MDPFTLAATGATIGSGVLSNVLNWRSTDSANRVNRQIARDQMDFQERMSNTAVQRHAADLEAAGFNRLLAAGGVGASTPSGAGATVKAPQVTPMDILAIQQARADINKTKADTILSTQMSRKALEEKFNIQEQNSLISAQVELTKAKVKSELVSVGYTKAQASKVVQSMFGDTKLKINVMGNGADVTAPNLSASEAANLVSSMMR